MYKAKPGKGERYGECGTAACNTLGANSSLQAGTSVLWLCQSCCKTKADKLIQAGLEPTAVIRPNQGRPS